EAALAQLPPGNQRTRRALEAAILHTAIEDSALYPRATQRLDRARAERMDDSPEARTLLAILAYHDTRAGSSLDDCVARAEQALAGQTPPPDEAVVFAFAGFVLAAADRFDAAASVCDDAIADARSRGSVFAFAVAAWLRGRVNHLRGALSEAEADLRNSIEAGRAHGLHPVLPYPVAKLADVLMDRGDLDEAANALASLPVAETVPDTPHLHTFMETRGRLRVLQGRPREGLADLLELGRRFEAIGGRNPAVIAWRSEAALALRALGKDERARTLAAEELELAQEWGAPRTLGRALRIAALVDDGGQQLQRLRSAVDVLAKSPALLERAHTLTDYGAALRRASQRAEARAPLRDAVDLARDCGAEPLVDRAHAELLATGARPRRLHESGIESLTASERRIAAMAAGGLTNREIAQALFVTPKTIEMHLHHAFRKLGVRSRTELASTLRDAAENHR
ncbi:MAG: LuxR C-terminal-related transcriptional regulator, partial [Actinomycetota bacterium]|nr:LuxR C-terminal-related transcriptional regulator [Actinomycetota bacterium]